MSNQHRYDPEDLELLLQSKTFSELLPEEKAFVLQYVENDVEYDAMRDTLLNLELLPEMEPAIVPKESTKLSLMEAFEAAHSSEAVVNEEENTSKLAAWWLWFWDTNKSLFQRPAFQLASLALVVTLVTYVATFNTENQVAQLTEQPKKEIVKEPVIKKESKKEKAKTPTTTASEDLADVTDQELLEVPEDATDKVPVELEVDENTLTDLASGDLEINEELMVASNETAVGSDSKFFDLANENNVKSLDEMTEKKAAMVEESITEDEGYFNDVSQQTSTPEVILDNTIINEIQLSDLRTTQGNSMDTRDRFKGNESDDFNLDKDISVSAPALKASNFSGLLSKLYTAE